MGWILLRKRILSLHSLWGDSKWLGRSTLLTFTWLQLGVCSQLAYIPVLFFIQGYVYLLCIHHDILEQSITEVEKVWCLPLTFPTPPESLGNQHINCPAINSTQEEATDPKHSQDFQTEHHSRERCMAQVTKHATANLYLSTCHVESKHFPILPLDCWIFYYLLFLNLSFLKPIVTTPSLGTTPFPKISDLIIVATTTVCLDCKNFLNYGKLLQAMQRVISFPCAPGTAASSTVSMRFVFKPYLICPLHYGQWLKLSFTAILVNLADFPTSSRIMGSTSFLWCRGWQKI